MKKWAKRIGAYILALVLVATIVPNVVFAIQDQLKLEKPDGPSELVEVFSQSGKMHHEEVDPSSFVDFSDAARAKDGLVTQIAETYNFATRELVNNGSDSQNYCLLICGDGYTASEQDKFLQVAQNMANYIMDRAPFNESNIRNKINIRAVCTVSNASGTSLDPNAPYDTFFRATFNNNGIERLVCVHDYNRVWNIVNQYMPECVCPIVVCNSEKYGGSGGSVCCLSAHSDSADIAFHEFGHTGGHLADEYWETTTDSSNRSEAPNRTHESDPSKCKWSDLVGTNNVGLYSFSEAGVNDWYRPHQSCEMRYLKQEFCEVCKRQIRSVIADNVNSKIADNTVINSASELKSLLEKVGNGAATAGKTVTLNSDINANFTLTKVGAWNGTFNGNGHKISNLKINGSGRSYGMFSELGNSGVIKNLALENCTMTSNEWYTGGFVGECKGRIEQCSFSGSVSCANAAGGFAGHLVDGGLIQDCYNLGTVTATNQVSGGIVGWQDGGTIKNCYNRGQTAATSGWNGGIVGYKPSGGTVSNCFYLTGTSTVENGATAKNDSDFSNGSLTNTLNSVNNVWKQGSGYPVFTFTSQESGGSTLPSGYSRSGTEWTELNYWSTYFANGWGGNPTGGYKDGGSYGNFKFYVENAGGGEWSIQLKTKEISTTSGHKYRCTVGYTSNMGVSNIKFKDDKTDTLSGTNSIASGNNSISVEFTTNGTAQMFFDLGFAPAGLKFDITSFKMEDITPTTAKPTTTKAPTTTAKPTTTAARVFNAFSTIEAEHFTSNQGGVIDTNSNASGGQNIGGVTNGVTMTYENVNFSEKARGFKLKYSSPRNTASGHVEIYVDNTNNKVGSISLPNNGGSWSEYGELEGKLSSEISSGKHTIITKYVTENGAAYVANVDYFLVIKSSQVGTINNGIEINGYSISTTRNGMRVVYSVDSKNEGKTLQASGMVYGLSDKVSASDLVVGSSNKNVVDYKSTNTGKLSNKVSNSPLGTSYAMTMMFAANTKKEFSTKFIARAYAKYTDGTYSYSDSVIYNIYDVADNLYKNRRMPNATRHNYLYNDILTKVKSSYARINY